MSPQSKTINAANLGIICTLGVDAMELVCIGPISHALLDAQHGLWELNDLRHGLRAAEAMGLTPSIRLPVKGDWMIESLLDAGCNSLLFPMVNDVQQARMLSQACYYPPMGLRSQSTCRGGMLDGKAYRQQFNAQFELLVMIEHVDAVSQLQAILQVPGISGCIIGPTDLASSLGDQNNTGKMDQIIEQIRQACKTHGKTVGIAVPDMRLAKVRIEQGFDRVYVSTDRKMLMQAAAKLAGQWESADESV